jgi:trimeric autotransporter adhesin
VDTNRQLTNSTLDKSNKLVSNSTLSSLASDQFVQDQIVDKDKDFLNSMADILDYNENKLFSSILIDPENTQIEDIDLNLLPLTTISDTKNSSTLGLSKHEQCLSNSLRSEEKSKIPDSTSYMNLYEEIKTVTDRIEQQQTNQVSVEIVTKLNKSLVEINEIKNLNDQSSKTGINNIASNNNDFRESSIKSLDFSNIIDDCSTKSSHLTYTNASKLDEFEIKKLIENLNDSEYKKIVNVSTLLIHQSLSHILSESKHEIRLNADNKAMEISELANSAINSIMTNSTLNQSVQNLIKSLIENKTISVDKNKINQVESSPAFSDDHQQRSSLLLNQTSPIKKTESTLDPTRIMLETTPNQQNDAFKSNKSNDNKANEIYENADNLSVLAESSNYSENIKQLNLSDSDFSLNNNEKFSLIENFEEKTQSNKLASNEKQIVSQEKKLPEVENSLVQEKNLLSLNSKETNDNKFTLIKLESVNSKRSTETDQEENTLIDKISVEANLIPQLTKSHLNKFINEHERQKTPSSPFPSPYLDTRQSPACNSPTSTKSCSPHRINTPSSPISNSLDSHSYRFHFSKNSPKSKRDDLKYSSNRSSSSASSFYLRFNESPSPNRTHKNLESDAYKSRRRREIKWSSSSNNSQYCDRRDNDFQRYDHRSRNNRRNRRSSYSKHERSNSIYEHKQEREYHNERRSKKSRTRTSSDSSASSIDRKREKHNHNSRRSPVSLSSSTYQKTNDMRRSCERNASTRSPKEDRKRNNNSSSRQSSKSSRYSKSARSPSPSPRFNHRAKEKEIFSSISSLSSSSESESSKNSSRRSRNSFERKHSPKRSPYKRTSSSSSSESDSSTTDKKEDYRS